MLSILIALAAFAADPAVVEGWSIIPGATDSCTMEAEFNGGSSLRVLWDQDDSEGVISMYNEDWKSVVDDKKYYITFDFGDYGMISAAGATGVNNPDLDLRGFTAYFSGSENLARIGAAPWVFVRNGSKTIGKFNLKGSRAAVLAVARCSADRSAEAEPSDPFSQ